MRPFVATAKFNAARRGVVLWLGLCLASVLTAAGDPHQTRQLLATLHSSTDLHARARALQQLTIVGTVEAVPALAALLDHAQLAQYAREALEALADPAADAALRDSLNTLSGDALIGAVASVGMRADGAAVPRLRQIVDQSSAAAEAALIALGRIGTPQAREVLTSGLTATSATTRAAAAEGLLIAADRLLTRGDSASAVALYDALRAGNVPLQQRLAATRGAIISRGVGGVGLMLEQLSARDVAFQQVGLRLIREQPGAAVTAAIVDAFPRLNPDIQALALAALVDRGDRAALPAVETAVSARNATVRVAALRALGVMGNNGSVPLLLQAITARDAAPEEVAAAQRSLGTIRAPDATPAVLRTLSDASPTAQVRLIAVLAERDAESAVAPLLALARHVNPAVSHAAWRALGVVARPKDLPALIETAITLADDAAKTLADRAIYGASMKTLEPGRRADPMIAALGRAKEPDVKIALLRPLGAVVRAMGGNTAAFAALRSWLNEPDARLQGAVAKTLAAWPDATPAPVLIEYVKRTPLPPERDAVFTGAVRMATSVAAGRDASGGDVVQWFRDLNGAVRTPDDKMSVVSGLGSLRRVEAVALLSPYLDDPAVRTEAGLAVVQIAPALLTAGDSAGIKNALARIVAQETDPSVRGRAARLLRGELPEKKQKARVKP